MSALKLLCCLLLTFHLNEAKKITGRTGVADTEPHLSSSTFTLFSDGEGCTLDPLQLHTFDSCGFNSSNPLIIITHGWSLDGVMERWVFKLAETLMTTLRDVNVVYTDWIRLANRHYAVAAQDTRVVGRDIANMLQLLKVRYQYPFKKVHLIGYSLGAHISGFAGSYLEGSEKIGRITGLDPAGPMFEGMSHKDRLSPDDAEFVDTIHTFTYERLGLSVGIKQAVGHYDFYPNGGVYQPGCNLQDIYHHVAELGLHGFHQTLKCSHERSVQLFIDSLLNPDMQSVAYRCTDEKTFEKGVCLDCRKNRCNTLGYHVRKVHSGNNKKFYLKTNPRKPYKLYHYQFKIQFINQRQIEPHFVISLTGTKDESQDVKIYANEAISGNRTLSFLFTLDKDIGDLMMLNLEWAESGLQRTVFDHIISVFPWGIVERPVLSVGKISIKVGESQERTSFCAMTNEDTQIDMFENKLLVRCKEEEPKQRRGRQRKLEVS